MAPKSAPKGAPAAKAAAPKPDTKKAPAKAAAPKPAAPKPTASKAAAPKPAASKAAAPKAAAPAPTPKGAAKGSKGRPAPGSRTGVYVKNWGTGSVADVKQIFGAAGKITSVQIRRRRYALVFFENAAAVKKAIDLFNEKEIMGSLVTVVPAKTAPKPDPHEGSSVVFLSPVFRESTKPEKVKELFGGMKVLRIRMYRQNYAYVYLDSPEAALRAVKEKNGTLFCGKKLQVALSTRSLEKDRAREQRAKVLRDAHNFKKESNKVSTNVRRK
uniref:Uncharacterized protein TCIL3000_11_14360 n=1 Tax=Trypanosoma congolense (strain IL3000) TaxID=1068625 RepID=G0V2P9_TRYCI|nr:unnamed protein product [Trypanosoma congolense IL3000]